MEVQSVGGEIVVVKPAEDIKMMEKKDEIAADVEPAEIDSTGIDKAQITEAPADTGDAINTPVIDSSNLETEDNDKIIDNQEIVSPAIIETAAEGQNNDVNSDNDLRSSPVKLAKIVDSTSEMGSLEEDALLAESPSVKVIEKNDEKPEIVETHKVAELELPREEEIVQSSGEIESSPDVALSVTIEDEKETNETPKSEKSLKVEEPKKEVPIEEEDDDDVMLIDDEDDEDDYENRKTRFEDDDDEDVEDDYDEEYDEDDEEVEDKMEVSSSSDEDRGEKSNEDDYDDGNNAEVIDDDDDDDNGNEEEEEMENKFKPNNMKKFGRPIYKKYYKKVVVHLKKKSIECLRKKKMHAMEDIDTLPKEGKMTNLVASLKPVLKPIEKEKESLPTKDDENKENENGELKSRRKDEEDIYEDLDDVVVESEAKRTKSDDFNYDLSYNVDNSSGDDRDEDTCEDDDDEAVDLSQSTESPEKSLNEVTIELSDTSPEKTPIKPSTEAKRKLSLEKGENVVKKEIEVIKDVDDEKEKVSSPKNEENAAKNPEIESTRKRPRSIELEMPSDNHELEGTPAPAKKLKRELETSFQTHDRLLKEYIETTNNNSTDDIGRHVEQLEVELKTLDEMIRAKEIEWNNMLHLKKVKEEIYFRLTRKQHVLDIMSTQVGGRIDEYNEFEKRPVASSSIVVNSSTPSSNKNELSINNISSISVPSVASSAVSSLANAIQSRANLKGSELAKAASQMQRNYQTILPKPVLSNHQQILNNLAMSAASSNLQSQQAASNLLSTLNSNLMNGHHNHHHLNMQPLQVGRQGVIKDVKSIIADFRQKHPEDVPRRGRRMKHLGGDMRGGRSSTEILEGNSRPSSNDSCNSNNNMTNSTTTGLNINEVLAQFAKLSQNERHMLGTSNLLANITNAAAAAAANKPAVTSNPNINNNNGKPYPEVSLHPIQSNASSADVNVQSNTTTSSTSSLLHGILTKTSARPNSANFNAFPSTLARLLTGPERQPATGLASNQQYSHKPQSGGINLSKNSSEITITPVLGSNLQQSLMQKQHFVKSENYGNMDDEADDSVDRLVIDEGEEHHLNQQGGEIGRRVAQEFHENDVPECQGCKKREAQFVCAGCSNQWYCSRECQVSAWDQHSEICSG